MYNDFVSWLNSDISHMVKGLQFKSGTTVTSSLCNTEQGDRTLILELYTQSHLHHQPEDIKAVFQN